MSLSDAPTPQIPMRPRPRSLAHSERVKLFGMFAYRNAPTPLNKEAIIVDPKWERENIVPILLPGGKRMRCHRLALEPFGALFEAWRAADLLHLILTTNGLYVPRYKRGKAGGKPHDLSNHSWGTALDLNAAWNPLGKKPAKIGSQGSLEMLVPHAYEHGFCWGGDFTTPDGMHFELVRP